MIDNDDDQKIDNDDQDDHEIDDDDHEIDNLTCPFSADNKDYRGTTLDEAINDKIHLPRWEIDY